MADGTRKNPYTREDVLRMIEENGGTAEKLDLSGKVFEEGIDLRGLDLKGIILKEAKFPTSFKDEILEGADLSGCYLKKADFTKAHLERADLYNTHLEGANLRDAHLEGARLWDTHLEDANLVRAHLEGANLMRTKFSSDVNLEDVDWGNYILGEEEPSTFDSAVASYRHLKVWYTNAGYSDIAAKFYYREKEASRKAAKRRCDRIAGWLSRAFFGHGEHWERILIWMAGFILLFGLIYFAIGSVWEWSAFGKSLYFSGASYTALGYGNWVQETNNWIRGIGVFESLVGVSMIALLLVTFVRKWTR